jgi:hypothetical protein
MQFKLFLNKIIVNSDCIKNVINLIILKKKETVILYLRDNYFVSLNKLFSFFYVSYNSSFLSLSS